MKVIFLDVDGVLNNATNDDVSPNGYTGIMDSKVELVKEIIDATGAVVVLSSDWRLIKDDNNLDYKYLEDKLNSQGIELYGMTDDVNWEHRGLEISIWLDHHDVDNFVILDDIEFNDFNKRRLINHLVITDDYDGLTQQDVDKAISILNNEVQ